jgi:uncharacterized protein YbjT (DUF2867 family)
MTGAPLHQPPRPCVLVAGATGYLGGHVVKELATRGYRVRALARDEMRLAEEVRACCDSVFVGQATEASTLEGLLGDASIVFSSIGKHDFKRGTTAQGIDYLANHNLLVQAEREGASRFVFISVMHGERLRDRGVASAAARERIVDELRASSMGWTVLRPTGFFNDMADVFNMAKGGTGWLIGDGAFRMNPIHGADLAARVADAVDDPGGDGRGYDVGGPQIMSYREMLELAFEALGTKPRLRSLPAWTLRAFAGPVGPFNPFVADLLRSVYWMSRWEAVAPTYGHRQLRAFYRELAEG